ncbi:3'-5' exoribonuclease [Desulfonema limicola]|uniref:3'-5' exoribonuclease n=1 Tax=Desulfonema limicola TaxID=45656 RepID=A0A975B8R7_9BACT|nr:HD domain-containing protein [Desulfonema limicola]QTA80902.1 3'-5' exoribonuclease [Desulfonema limicola]
MKKQFIDKLSPGDKVDDLFVLSEKTMSQKKNGDNYLNFTFSDKTGDIKGVAWDNIDQIAAAAKSGDFVRVKGGISDYKGGLQLTVRQIDFCTLESVDPADFLPVTKYDPDKMFEQLKRTVEQYVTDKYLKELIQAFWDDKDFVEKFKRAPAAKKMHHAYIGGLLEHTLSMTVLVQKIAEHYKRTLNGINMSLLLTGTIFHDIGKIREFEYNYKIDYSDEGRLVSHIVIGCGIVDEKIRQVQDFPKQTEMLLKHLIVSHHGSKEFGSPEVPRTIEAVLLNHIDNIDAKMNGLREFIEKEAPDESWTSYNYMMGCHLYKGIKE